MKKMILLSLIVCIASKTLLAQHISTPSDSIATLLCKKWEVDYAMMDGMKIGRIPGATDINYEFNKDKTFTITSDDAKKKSKGTWAYGPKKKFIRLTVNGQSNTKIMSLKEGELIMSIDTKKSTPDDHRLTGMPPLNTYC